MGAAGNNNNNNNNNNNHKHYFLPTSPLGSRWGTTANIKHIKLIKNIVYMIKTSLKHPKIPLDRPAGIDQSLLLF